MTPAQVAEQFRQRFPTGTFYTLDFRPHFAGFAHNAWIGITPQSCLESTRQLAYLRLGEMVEFFRSAHGCFGQHDRLQLAVGFPETIKPIRRRILRGWIPTERLRDVTTPEFAAVGGAFAENDQWMETLWD